VSLWGLPVQFWNRKLLVALANNIGKFLFMDDAMLRSHDKRRALFLVEFVVDDGLPERIDILWDGRHHYQTIDYLFIPFRCFRCQRTGHLRSKCHSRSPAVSKRTTYHSKGTAAYQAAAEQVTDAERAHHSGKEHSKSSFVYEDLTVEELEFIANIELKA